MKLLKSIFLFISLVTQLSLSAQFHPMLDDFNAFEFKGEVYINWTIGRGNICNGIQIERSSNNQFFDVIGDIAGICGSADFAQSYNWIDRTPVQNATNYYRLELGFNGHSESVAVEVISLPDGGYQVRPNPINSEGVIYFRNNYGKQHVLMIYDLSGRSVVQYETVSNSFQIDAGSLYNGLYLFSISSKDNSSVIAGKFSVAR